MKLIIASNNSNKITEIKDILKDDFDDILSMGEAGLTDDIEEPGETFIENALIKAHYVAEKLNCAAIADDSGLEVDALHGAPGVYSARYCGHHGDDDKNNDKLLENMKNKTHRDARFTCAIALVRPNKDDIVAQGHCVGEILHKRRGTGGFGYDPLFYMARYNKTMAELDSVTKNTISHRYAALCAIKEKLDK